MHSVAERGQPIPIVEGRGQQYSQFYAYDRQSQLIAAQSARQSSTLKTTTRSDARVWRYRYDRNGNRTLAQENVAVAEMGRTRQAVYELARYRYNRHGLRVGKQTASATPAGTTEHLSRRLPPGLYNPVSPFAAARL